MEDGRDVEIYSKNFGTWIDIPFTSLRVGDAFRMFDNGQRYINVMDGNNVWIATSNPYVNKDGIYTIDTLY